MTTYTVRQHIPDFVSGYESEIIHGVDEADLTNPAKVPWLKRFEHEGFVAFKVEPYVAGKLIVSGYYDDGKHWVASVATPETARG